MTVESSWLQGAPPGMGSLASKFNLQGETDERTEGADESRSSFGFFDLGSIHLCFGTGLPTGQTRGTEEAD
jgi:hypothetical protein